MRRSAQAPRRCGVASRFFEVQVRAQVGGTRCELTSVLHRNPETGELTLLSRTYGKRFELTLDEDAADGGAER